MADVPVVWYGAVVIDNIVDQLKRDEGFSSTAYKDSLGFWTIGYGHKLRHQTSVVWSQVQAEAQLKLDVLETFRELRLALPWVDELDVVRRGVLQNMTFNLGTNGLLKFNHTLALLKAEQWAEASVEMLRSAWATQVGARATRLSKQVLTGDWQ